MGFVLSYLYEKKNNIYVPILAHMSNNFISVILMMIIPLLGMLVLYVGMIYASLMFIISYIDLADISSDKKGYALLISFVLTIVAVCDCSFNDCINGRFIYF